MVAQWTLLLERRWIAPAYAGWVVMTIAICFFGAATNTMTGWLYVLSAICLVLAAVAAILPARSLNALSVEHLPIAPITAGEDLKIVLRLHNRSTQPQILFQLYDLLPPELGPVAPIPIECVPAQGTHDTYVTCTPARRGLYSWDRIELRSGQPLGLFWCRRGHVSPARAWVYPQRLRLAHCPIMENLSNPRSIDLSLALRRPQLSTAGSTRSLRSYRNGDPLRLVHWRSSARYGELQVRELEDARKSTSVTIALDTTGDWTEVGFEQAVIAATSLYFYGVWQQLNVQFWSSSQGFVEGQEAILRALAEIKVGKERHELPNQPLLWLTAGGSRISQLPLGSRYLSWGHGDPAVDGFSVDPLRPLAAQLQQPLRPSHG
jgi:uncharacterized protein (DUF58 family)